MAGHSRRRRGPFLTAGAAGQATRLCKASESPCRADDVAEPGGRCGRQGGRAALLLAACARQPMACATRHLLRTHSPPQVKGRLTHTGRGMSGPLRDEVGARYGGAQSPVKPSRERAGPGKADMAPKVLPGSLLAVSRSLVIPRSAERHKRARAGPANGGCAARPRSLVCVLPACSGLGRCFARAGVCRARLASGSLGRVAAVCRRPGSPAVGDLGV